MRDPVLMGARRGRGPRSLLRALVLCSAVGAEGCGAALEVVPHPEPLPSATTTVFLVGDAGDAFAGDPVMEALRGDVATSAETSEEVVVLFLGDNVYDRGVRPPNRIVHEQDTAILSAQVEAVRGLDARVIFIPGNHDWDDGGPAGYAAVLEQGRYLERAAAAGARTSIEPYPPGCPGPAPIDFPSVRVIAIDTQWFLHAYTKRADGCAVSDLHGLADELAALIDGAGDRQVIVAAHHPLESNGPHGGYIPPSRHLFPLLDMNPGLYIPLPILGSIYMWARGRGVSEQDQAAAEYQVLVEGLEEGFARASRRALAYAAGHEHSLDVIPGAEGQPRFLLVSGSASRTSDVRGGSESLFAASERGYMRLEFQNDGDTRLSVMLLNGGGEGWCAFLPRDGEVRLCR